MLCFGRDGVFASKTANIKIWNRTTKTKKESFKLKISLFKLLRSWMYKFQCEITVFVSLTIALGTD